MSFRVGFAEERHGQIESAAKMAADPEAGARPVAAKAKMPPFTGQHVMVGKRGPIEKEVDAPLRALGIGPARQRRAAQLEGADKAAVGTGFRFVIAADCCDAAGTELLVLDQRVGRKLALYAAAGLKPGGELMRVRQVGA